VVASTVLALDRRQQWNIDDQPFVTLLDAFSQPFSPYTWSFIPNALTNVLTDVLPDFGRLNAGEPKLFVCATGVRDNTRKVFTAPDLSIDTLLASACEPLSFRAVQIGDERYWDGGFIGNPAIQPLLEAEQGNCDDIVVVQINPIQRTDGWPETRAAIIDRVNEISFNASLLLEVDTIHTLNKVVERAKELGQTWPVFPYRTIRLHKIGDEAFMQTLGLASKNNPFWPFLEALFAAGRGAAEGWIGSDMPALGKTSSWNIEVEVKPMLRSKGG